MNFLKYFIDLILAVLIMFVFVTMNLYHKQDLLMQDYLRMAVREFTDNVSVHGYVTPQMYEAFLDEIRAAGKIADVNILHEKILYMPEYEGETFAGAGIYYENFYEYEITRKLYEEGVYYFGREDRLTVCLDLNAEDGFISDGTEKRIERTIRIRNELTLSLMKNDFKFINGGKTL